MKLSFSKFNKDVLNNKLGDLKKSGSANKDPVQQPVSNIRRTGLSSSLGGPGQFKMGLGGAKIGQPQQQAETPSSTSNSGGGKLKFTFRGSNTSAQAKPVGAFAAQIQSTTGGASQEEGQEQ